ncbi:MFS transporter [Streptomyces sp. ODS28]|uniref:MFS transporter n=1 Tax=Streptomyces sp. ODS28 TaxID=3136688 RepID=UPI0031E77D03
MSRSTSEDGGADTAEDGIPRGGAARFDRRLVPPMILGSVLNPVNSSVIAVALVPIGAAFGAPPSQTAWLVSALYLATALGQPVVGRLIDLFGPRRLFLIGTSLVGLAGVLGMVAPSLGVLVAARVVLGFGTCAGYPAAMALLRGEADRTGTKNPGGVLTVLAIANQTVAVIGPSLGGLLIGLGGWRTTFALNIPLAAVALLLGALRLPKPERMPSVRGRLAARLDLPGMALFAVMLVALLLFLMDLRHPGAGAFALLALSAVAGALFARRELRAAEPFLDLRLLGGNRPLLATYARGLVAYVVSYAVLYGFTQWVQQGRGLSASGAGLVQVPLFLTAIGVSAYTGRRPGVYGKLVAGAVFQVVACVLLFLLDGDSPVWLLLATALLFGLPQGLNSLALQNSVYRQADPARMGSSSGLLRTFAYMGSMIVSAATAYAYPERADTAGMHELAWVMLGAGVLFLLMTVFDRGLRRVGAEDAAPNTT